MQNTLSRYSYRDGLKDGLPIALGYISVSFGFGILAAKGALSALTATLISLTNVTSAGQLAGLDIILAAGPLTELIVTELIINIRYALMSISLTQKLDDGFTTVPRLICAFCMTDEVFGVASAKKGIINKTYFYGLMTLPVIGWTLGTFLGATAGYILPESVKDAMGILLYAMFVAIFLPPATENSMIAVCVTIAAALSAVIAYVPAFSGISSGFSVVICAVVAALAASVWSAVRNKDAEEEEDRA